MFDGRRGQRGKEAVVAVRIESVESLFDARDPAPVPGRDLDPGIAGYLSERLEGGRGRRPRRVRLVLCFDEPVPGEAAAEVRAALRAALGREAERAEGRFRALMTEGRRSLLISTSFVALVLVFVTLVWGPLDEVPLLVGGWVSIASWVVLWRPIEIFFYDWWPIQAERRMWRRLADAETEIRAVPA